MTRSRKNWITPEHPERRVRWPLQRWQLLFANWLLAEPTTPTREQQEEAATRLANEKRYPETSAVRITYRQIRGLKTRPDWQEYVKRVQKGGVEAARAMFVNDLPLYMELHRWAAEHAKAVGDHRAMAQLTTPAVDRVVPKHEGALSILHQQQIIINLSPKQREVLDAAHRKLLVERIIDQEQPGDPEPPQKTRSWIATAIEAHADDGNLSRPERGL